MSIAEIIPAIDSLSRADQIQLARLLIDRLADENLTKAVEGKVLSIETPEFGFDAASQLSRTLATN